MEVIRAALMASTVVVCLLVGAYITFSSSAWGAVIPAKLQKYLMLPALFNRNHQKPLPYSKQPNLSIMSIILNQSEIGYAPSRIVSFTISLYVIMNIIFCSVPYKSVQPNT
jgi:hypothetical protein